MQYFEERDGKLIFRYNGETVQVEAWGQDSLRVRSRVLGEISEECSAAIKNDNGVRTTTISVVVTLMEIMNNNVPIMVITPVNSCVNPISRPSENWSTSAMIRLTISPCA